LAIPSSSAYNGITAKAEANPWINRHEESVYARNILFVKNSFSIYFRDAELSKLDVEFCKIKVFKKIQLLVQIPTIMLFLFYFFEPISCIEML